MTCNICCDDFNNSTRKNVICPFSDCQYSACKSCVRQYLLGTTKDPHCLNCKKAWPDDFVISTLNRSFFDKEYKEHRKKLLLERELSRLPETMPLATRSIQVDKEQAKITESQTRVKELNALINAEKQKQNVHREQIRALHNKDTPEERRKFTMPCPHSDCKGYLSTQYKCELCSLFTCPDCFEIIGHNKNDPHTCDPNSVASAKSIKDSTKPCPQCGVRIFKISGCDQMWCTQCQIAFSYKTLKIDSGPVHNPHYYNHLRADGAAPRNPQDVLCGGLCSFRTLNSHIIDSGLKALKFTGYGLTPRDFYLPTFNSPDIKISFNDSLEYLPVVIRYIHMVCNHITNYDLPDARTRVRNLNDNLELRIDYIRDKKDKAQFTQTIYSRDKQRKKGTEILNLLELFSVVSTERFNQLCNTNYATHHFNKIIDCEIDFDKIVNLKTATPNARKTIIQHIKKNIIYATLAIEMIVQLDNLRRYFNFEMAKISAVYSNKVSQISINNITSNPFIDIPQQCHKKFPQNDGRSRMKYKCEPWILDSVKFSSSDIITPDKLYAEKMFELKTAPSTVTATPPQQEAGSSADHARCIAS